MAKQKIVIVVCLLLVVTSSVVSGCGWFLYEDFISEDNPNTRAYYNIFDDLSGVEDSILLISRLPNNLENKKNVYIPMQEEIMYG